MIINRSDLLKYKNLSLGQGSPRFARASELNEEARASLRSALAFFPNRNW